MGDRGIEEEGRLNVIHEDVGDQGRKGGAHRQPIGEFVEDALIEAYVVAEAE